MRRPSFATVTAVLALVVATSGSAYAYTLGANTVQSRHIVNDSVQGKDIRDGTLQARDLAEGVLPADIQIRVETKTTADPLNPGEATTLTAFCPGNSHAIAGGVRGDEEDPDLVAVTGSNPYPRADESGAPKYVYGWQGSVVNNDTGTTDISPMVWVICTEGLQ